MLSTHEEKYEACDTIFYQGAHSSQTQVLNYTGNRFITATTGEVMFRTGMKNLKPLNVIYHLHIGPEIMDVNLHPYTSLIDYINPFKIIYTGISWAKNYFTGTQILPTLHGKGDSVAFHSANLSQMSYGQESDIASHYNKYLSWKEDPQHEGLILYGTSRGTITLTAYALHKYKEVRLVILEGAIDSMENIIKNQAKKWLKNDTLASYAVEKVHGTLGFLNRYGLLGYKRNGISPLSMLDEVPENTPIVFITSAIDGTVPPENTENIATLLAQRGKNDVYLLKLKNSRHPFYMYDDENDRNQYETFIHAIYKKYKLEHDPLLAEKGEHLLEECCIGKAHSAQTLNLH